MANKLAPYKRIDIMDSVLLWWETSDPPHLDIEEMFYDYTATQLDEDALEDIISLEDFERCIYRHGIRRLGDGENQVFVQAKTWRPSLDQVMRFPGWDNV